MKDCPPKIGVCIVVLSSLLFCGSNCQDLPCSFLAGYVVDDSVGLNSDNFQKQLNFLSTELLTLNAPERLQVTTQKTSPAIFGQFLNISLISDLVLNLPQTTLPYSLGDAINTASGQIYFNINTSIPQNLIVFISDTNSPGALDGAVNHINVIKSVGYVLTFVLMGPNADAAKLANFSTNFIDWTDMTQPRPRNWTASAVYGCQQFDTTTVATIGSSTVGSTMDPTTASTTIKTRQPLTVHTTVPFQPSSTTSSAPAAGTTTTGAVTVPTIPQPSPGPDPGYVPCETFIAVSADNTMKLTADSFKTQLNFINSIFGGMNHPERLMYSYSSSTPVVWYSGQSIQQIQASVSSSFYSPANTYSLSRSLKTLYGSMVFSVNYTIPLNALVFVSDTSDPANIDGADRYASILKNLNVRITIVLMGNSVDQNLLANITNNFVVWSDLSQSQPANWGTVYGPVFGCTTGVSTLAPSTGPTTPGQVITTSTGAPSTVPSTPPPTSPSTPPPTSPSTIPSTVPSISPSTIPSTVPSTIPSTPPTTPPSTLPSTPPTTPSPTTGTTIAPYIPCQSFIAYCVDNSNALSSTDFTTQINFMSSAVSALTHAERVAVQAGKSLLISWNSYNNIPDVVNKIKTISKNDVAFSLQNVLKTLYSTTILSPNSTVPVAAVVFVTDTNTPGSIDGAATFANLLKNNGVRITVVLVGANADQSKLTNITDNFISWTDLSQPQPTNWNSLYGPAYGCTGGVSTVPTTPPPTNPSTPPSTIPSTNPSTGIPTSVSPTTSPSILSSTLPSTIPSTVPSTPSPTGTTFAPYIPCQSFIAYCVDNSNALSSTDFTTQVNFLSSAVSALTHAERVSIQAGATPLVPWDGYQQISNIISQINTITQTGQAFNLRSVLRSLYGAVTNSPNTTVPMAAVIFVTDTNTPGSVDGADSFANMLKDLGVKLTVILVGANADQSKLTNITDNFISWTDLSQPQPTNWNSLYGPAYGCTGGVSTVPTTLPSTNPSTPPSTVPTSPQPPTSTTPGGPTTTPTPAYPCNAHIPFGVDTSLTLTAAQFGVMKSLILDPFLNIVYPAGLTPAPWVSYSQAAYTVRPAQDKNGLIKGVNVTLAQGTYTRGIMTEALKLLNSNQALVYTDALPINTVLFTGTELQGGEVSDLQTLVNTFTAANSTVIAVIMTDKIDITTSTYNQVTGISLVSYNSDTRVIISDLQKLMRC